jgi:hypothetical protein
LDFKCQLYRFWYSLKVAVPIITFWSLTTSVIIVLQNKSYIISKANNSLIIWGALGTILGTIFLANMEEKYMTLIIALLFALLTYSVTIWGRIQDPHCYINRCNDRVFYYRICPGGNDKECFGFYPGYLCRNLSGEKDQSFNPGNCLPKVKSGAEPDLVYYNDYKTILTLEKQLIKYSAPY